MLLITSTAAAVAAALSNPPYNDGRYHPAGLVSEGRYQIAGSVVDKHGVYHDLLDQGQANIRLIADKVDGKFLVLKTHAVDLNFDCRFCGDVLHEARHLEVAETP